MASSSQDYPLNATILTFSQPLHLVNQKGPKLAFAPWDTNDAKLTAELSPIFRSSSPYSMVEAEITDSMYTPPSSNVRAIKNPDENAFVDDTFDVASFSGSDFGSHAASHKTHGVSEYSKEVCYLANWWT